MADPKPQTPQAPENPSEHLEKAIVVIDIKAWIALGAILLVIISTLIWAFFGTMYVREEVSGVLVRSGKTMNLYASEDSYILDMSIDRGDEVVRDQVIARLDQSELVGQINALLDTDGDATELAILRHELLERSQIRAGGAGTVQDIYVLPGDYVSRGTKIATIHQAPRTGASRECLLFVPAAQMKNIEKGMQVNVFPASVNKDEYGNIYGTVAFISEYPVTLSYLQEVLGSEELAQQYASGQVAYYEITVSLVTSETTATGYRWTTSDGPSRQFGDLTLCEASIVIDELRPFDVFFNFEL